MEIDFLQPWSFTANANQSNESFTWEKLIFTTLEIDFYHRGNLFLPLWN